MNRSILFLLLLLSSFLTETLLYAQNQAMQEVCINDPETILKEAERGDQQPDQVIRLSNQALTLLSESDRQDLTKNQYNRAIENLLKSTNIYRAIDDSSELAQTLNAVGACYLRKDLYTLALDYFQKALSVNERFKNRKSYGNTLNNIGIIYRKIGQLEKSLEYYKECHDIFKSLGDKAGFSTVENNIGLIYVELEKYQDALTWFSRSIETRLALNDTINIANAYNNLGEVHEKINNYPKALKYYEESVRLYQIVNNRHGLAVGFCNLARLYYLTSNYNKAKYYLDKSQLIAEADGENSIVRSNYTLYSNYYFAIGDYGASKREIEKYVELTEKIFNDQVSKELAEQSIKFENEHIELENRVLQANLEVERYKLRRSMDFLLFYIVISIVITSLLVYTLYFIRKLRNKSHQIEQINAELSNLNLELEDKVAERTRELTDALKKAEESDKLKSAFLANMSHEVRTPMNAIIGFAKILENEDVPPEERKRYLEVISHQGRNLLQIINDIISLSKLETGQMEIQKSICNANKILDNLFLMFSDSNYLNRKSGVTLKLNKALSDKESNFVTDPFKVEQILINLIDNAHKFTAKGEIEFGYTVGKQNTITFFVNDTGSGIPDDQHEMIFNRFYKHSLGEHSFFGGAGLGLSISKKLAIALGGDLLVESKLNSGSRFNFTIPFAYADLHVDTTFSKWGMISTARIWPGKVLLVVEDDNFSYQYIEALLQGTKFTIIHARSGEDAITVCQSDEIIDLVLMDIQLPFMSGYDATQQIKAIRKDIPIIAQTANVLNDEKNLSLKAGCDYYITKPIDPEDLYSAISKCLDKIDSFVELNTNA